MKKILLTAAVALTLGLTSCGGGSTADKQQIQDARQAAGEMLDNIHRNGADTPAPAMPQRTDTIAQN